MTEKSIEVLTAELEAIKKANLEREIELEKAKVVAADKLKKEEEDKIRYDEIKQRVISDMQGESKIVKDTAEPKGNEYEEYFRKPFIKRLGLKGLDYDDIVMELKNGNFRKIKGGSK